MDDPVVAGDAIKSELAAGQPRIIAAWLGPTRLATAILFATITNIVAYLPFLLLTGDTGRFLYSLPIVIACSLVASPYGIDDVYPAAWLLPAAPQDRAVHCRAAQVWLRGVLLPGRRLRRSDIAGRSCWRRLCFSRFGAFAMSRLKQQFFPKDLSYLSYRRCVAARRCAPCRYGTNRAAAPRWSSGRLRKNTVSRIATYSIS